MEQLTDRIASLSFQTVILVLAGLTAARLLSSGIRAAWGRSLSDLLESGLIAVALVFLLLRPFVVQSFFIPSGSMRPTLCEGDHILVNKWSYRVGQPRHGEVLVFRAPRDAAPDEKDFIKRLVGLPGDTIEVREGFVMIGRGPSALKFTRSEIRSVLGTLEPALGAGAQPLRLNTNCLWLGTRRISKEEFARAAKYPGRPVHIEPGKVLRNNVMLSECYVAEDPTYRWGPKVVPPGHLFVMGDNRNESHDSHIWGMLPEGRVIGRAEWVFWPLKHLKRIE